MVRGLNHSLVVVFRTRSPDVRSNICDNINYSSIRFLSSILLVVLLAPFCVSAVVPSLFSRADSLPIAKRS
jgi:hypothetical protein